MSLLDRISGSRRGRKSERVTGVARPAPLGAVARRLLLATFIGALGTGLVLPFLVVYLAQVRGMPTYIGGFVIAWTAMLGFVLTPLGGWLIDSVGPRPVILGGLAAEAMSAGAWAFVREPWQAFAVASLAALGGAGVWSAATTFLARSVTEDQRQRAFGISFMMVNLGIGVGGLIAGLAVNVDQPVTFERLYLADALFVTLGLVVIATLRGEGGPLAAADEPDAKEGGYREVFADRSLMRLAVVSIVMLTCGYGAIEVGYPVFATTQAGLSERLVAFGYVANTVAILVGQLYVLRLIQGRSRSRVIALVGVVWAGAWLLLGLSVPLAGAAAVAVALASPLVFGLGETLWQPVVPSIVNDLAPERMRGRYNAVGALTWSVSATLGPAFTGILLGVGLAGTWIILVIAGCLVASLGALHLRSVLTVAQDGRGLGAAAEVGG